MSAAARGHCESSQRGKWPSPSRTPAPDRSGVAARQPGGDGRQRRQRHANPRSGRTPVFSARPKSSWVPSTAAVETTRASTSPPYQTIPASAGWRQRRPGPAWRDCSRRRRHPPEAAVAALKVQNGLEQVAAGEVGPEHGGHVELRVRHLPEQEVGEPVLAGPGIERRSAREMFSGTGVSPYWPAAPPPPGGPASGAALP